MGWLAGIEFLLLVAIVTVLSLVHDSRNSWRGIYWDMKSDRDSFREKLTRQEALNAELTAKLNKVREVVQ